MVRTALLVESGFRTLGKVTETVGDSGVVT